ncbi:hypothetical protein C0J52_24475 [Blattella germanica]|nr:hypothetical protein C0J52_24475 [Blattella germanica]
MHGYVAYRAIAQNGHANADTIVPIEISPSFWSFQQEENRKKEATLRSLQGHNTNYSMKKRKRGLTTFKTIYWNNRAGKEIRQG